MSNVLHINIKKKDTTTVKETCSQCDGNGFHNSSYFVSHDYEYKGVRHSEASSEDEWVGCSVCGGSGSFPAYKFYSNSIFSSAQSKYDRDFNNAIKKGSGKVIVKYETFPCKECGKYHGERDSNGFFIGTFHKKSFSAAIGGYTHLMPCDGHTEIREISREPYNGWF